jgi:hypothetical protein
MALQLKRNTRESCSGGLKRVAGALQRRWARPTYRYHRLRTSLGKRWQRPYYGGGERARQNAT